MGALSEALARTLYTLRALHSISHVLLCMPCFSADLTSDANVFHTYSST